MNIKSFFNICKLTSNTCEFTKMLAGTNTSMPLQIILLSKSDSSSNSSDSHDSINATPHFGMEGSKAIMKKSHFLVPRLDLSRTKVAVGLGTSVEMASTLGKIQQKSSHSPCEQFENPGRRTSRKIDSARLISMTNADDHFGNNTESARMMLSRIKRRAKGASCSRKASRPINEVNVTSFDDNINVVMKKPFEEVVQGGVNIANDISCEPLILDIVEVTKTQSVNENNSTRELCKDGENC